MIVLWVWIGAVVVALVTLAIVAFDLMGRLRRFRRAADTVVADRLPRAQALLEGVQLRRSSGRHSAVRPAEGPLPAVQVGDGAGTGGVASATASASSAGEDKP